MSNMIERNTHPSQTRKSNDASFAKIAFGAICAFGLGIWVFYDLSRLESGAIESTRVWAPIAMLYESLGFWPAVSVLPAFGCLHVWRSILLLHSNREAKTTELQQQIA